MSIKQTTHGLDVSSDELRELIRSKPNPENITKLLLFLIGILLTPITLLGVVLGYGRAHNRLLKPLSFYPRLYSLPPIIRVAMIIGGVVIWVAIVLAIGFVTVTSGIGSRSGANEIIYFVGSLLGTILIYFVFSIWRNRKVALMIERERFGTARFAAIGQTSFVTGLDTLLGLKAPKASQKALVSPAEVRRGSGDNIFVFIGAKPPALFAKWPYYQMGELIGKDGIRRYDENPYLL